MPRLGNALRDISTERLVPTPGNYVAQLTVEDTKSKAGKEMTVITFKLVGGEFDGVELKEYFVTEGKTPGEYNEAGLRGLKRTAQAILGERVNEDDFDTAELNDTMASIIVKADSFDDSDTGEKVQTAKVKRVLGPA